MFRILTSSKLLIPTFVIAFAYVILTTYLMNVRLVQDTIFGSFALTYKASLLFSLLQGMWTAMSGSALILLFATGLLTGANLTLLVKQIKQIGSFKNLHFVVGGNTFLGLAGAGCAACGLPVLSMFGLSGAFLFLPWRGTEFSYLAVILLSISLYLLLISSRERDFCRIPERKK